MENANEWSLEDDYVDIWVDNYVVSSSEPLDYATMTVVTGPSSGSVDIDDEYGFFTYTPDPDFTGYDAFSYTVCDELNSQSNEVWVFISVYPTGSYGNFIPVISGFRSENLGSGYWKFSGYIQDEDPSSGTLSFGGLLSGASSGIGTYGYFSATVYLSSPGSGNCYVEFEDEFSVGAEASIIGFTY